MWVHLNYTKNIWRDTLRGNMKEWGIPVINVSTLQLQKRSKETFESKHEGMRYPCDKCEYSAISKGYLKYTLTVKRRELVIFK